MHYIPLKSHIINKYREMNKKNKQIRSMGIRKRQRITRKYEQSNDFGRQRSFYSDKNIREDPLV